MSTRLVALWVDAVRPAGLARFWAALLGWEVVDDHVVRAPVTDGCELDFVFVPERAPKTGKNRVHLDLASYSASDQRAKVERALSLGAQRKDVGQGEVPWEVLADPEGNEFCVLEPRPGYTTTETVAAIVVDMHDPLALASFWSGQSGWRIGARQEVVVGLRAPTGRGPWLEFLHTPDPLDRPTRLRLALAGAPDAPERVKTDPEGTEFVLLNQG
ncbi:VOC family protein [Amycolatopsis sacchari]|uniref:VOC family protein n=1 Tax=Amycolatopsis sacchari TaxID=115433 RepID=UPI003D73C887